MALLGWIVMAVEMIWHSVGFHMSAQEQIHLPFRALCLFTASLVLYLLGVLAIGMALFTVFDKLR